jgi:glycosyltransferase involved in cell wall biosynthesis
VRIAIWWEQESWGGVDTHLATLLGAWPAADRFTIFHNASNPGVKRIAVALAERRVELVAMPEWRRKDRCLARRLFDYGFLPLLFLRWIQLAKSLLADHGPFDALIANNGSYPGAWTCLAALGAAKRIGIRKRVLLVHHAAAPYSVGRAWFERAVDRAVQSWATDIVAVSRATRETLVRLRVFDTEYNPIRVIHNGVRLPARLPPSAGLRQSWGLKEGDIALGMMGRIERYKGHEDVLLAMSEMPEELRARARLIVVGDGAADEKSRLRTLAERLDLAGQIVFTGYIDAPSPSIISEFDVLILATKDFEGFGLSAAEAMAIGTPVLATTVGGTTEFMSEETALLVPPESPSDMARALEAHMRDPDVARGRVHAAHRAIANFSDVSMAARFHRLLTL